MKRLLCLILALTALWGCGGPGLRNAVNAEYWYDQGQRQFRDGRYDEAAVSFARAENLASDNTGHSYPEQKCECDEYADDP